MTEIIKVFSGIYPIDNLTENKLALRKLVKWVEDVIPEHTFNQALTLIDLEYSRGASLVTDRLQSDKRLPNTVDLNALLIGHQDYFNEQGYFCLLGVDSDFTLPTEIDYKRVAYPIVDELHAIDMTVQLAFEVILYKYAMVITARYILSFIHRHVSTDTDMDFSWFISSTALERDLLMLAMVSQDKAQIDLAKAIALRNNVVSPTPFISRSNYHYIHKYNNPKQLRYTKPEDALREQLTEAYEEIPIWEIQNSQ